MSVQFAVIASKTRHAWEGSYRCNLELLMKVYHTDRMSIRTADFLQWQENQCLVLSPKFQRRGVWKLPARSFFIDTILRGMPVPPIYLRALPPQKGKTRIVHEVVDGQQRVRTVLDFVAGKFRLSKTLNAPWEGRRYSQLTEKDQQQIVAFGFPAEVFESIPDEEVLNVFSRLNTYSVPLNAQELRNGKYFGAFKQMAYKLANEHLKFWERNNLFTPRAIARMQEVEFTSELLIAGHLGMQDKKKCLDKYYPEWDEDYPDGGRDATRFRAVIDEISEVFSLGINHSQFSRKPLFYSLFCAIFHHLYGMPGEKIATPKRPLTSARRANLFEAATRLSEVVSSARAENEDDEEDERVPVPEQYASFVKACLSQTDNIGPRRVRFRTLWKTAF